MTVRRIPVYLIFPLLGVSLFFYFQVFGEFHFLYMEQFQLFQYTVDYCLGYLGEIGGFSTYIANFLMQFYKINFSGALISSLLLTSIAFFSYRILLTLGQKGFAFLGILTIVPFLVLHLMDYYYLAGTVSLLLTLSGILLTIKARSFTPYPMLLLVSSVLFWISGSFAYQYLLLMGIIYAVGSNRRDLYYTCMILVLMFLAGLIALRTGMVAKLSYLFTMDAFFHPRLEPPFNIYLSFVFLAGSLLLIWLINLSYSRIKVYVSYSLSFVIICLACFITLKKGLSENIKDSFLKELDYYAQTGQWDKILSKGTGEKDNHLYMNYINLALLKKGELSENMFSYDQRNLMSLMVTWDKTQRVSNLLSDIAFATGQVAMAQHMSFEALVNYSGCMSGRSLQRLVETNIIGGAYPVACKYLDILDKTLFYHDWSEEYRKYIKDIDSINDNPELKNLVASLSSVDNLMGYDPFLQELINCIYTNENNKNVIGFAEAYLMLTKDMGSIKRFIETFYGTDVLPKLSKSMQEAVIIYSENDPDYWVKYGVSDEIINRFTSFKSLVLENRGNASVASTVKRYYGDTFWYFYMYKS